MSSAMRRLGHEISKLGLRMRNKSPSGSETDVYGSTDEMTTGEHYSPDQQGNTWSQNGSCENRSSSECSFVAATNQVKQRRHSRNELDEDVECRQRKSSIKAALKPVLSRKSRSDLAKYPRLNLDLTLAQESLIRNGSKNSIKENDNGGIVASRRDKNRKKDEESSMGHLEAGRHADKKTKERRRGARMKRSKSFSGLLGWRNGTKQDRKNSAENDDKWTSEFPRKIIRRTSSLSKVDSRSIATETDSISGRFSHQASMIPERTDLQRNASSKVTAEIFLTSQSSNGDGRASSRGNRKQSEIRFSYMALKGFRFDEGMIETDLCSTEL